MLTFYNPREALVIQYDSNAEGLGTALLQGKSLTYACRAFTFIEQWYAQIEKEM